MLDPLNVFAVDELKKLTGRQITTLVTTETELLKAINQYYGAEGSGSFEDVIKKAQATGLELLKGEEELPEKLEKIAGEASVIQLVNMLLARAVADGASDIHVEPDEDILRVRLRVDGVLNEAANLPLKLHPAVISRVKILGGARHSGKEAPSGRKVLCKGVREGD